MFLGLVVSLVRGEFLPNRAKTWLLGSSIGSLFVLALLTVGENMTGQHADVPSFFTYIGATILVIGMVRLMPPYRSARWLSSKLTNETGGSGSGAPRGQIKPARSPRAGVVRTRATAPRCWTPRSGCWCTNSARSGYCTGTSSRTAPTRAMALGDTRGGAGRGSSARCDRAAVRRVRRVARAPLRGSPAPPAGRRVGAHGGERAAASFRRLRFAHANARARAVCAARASC